MKILMYTGAFLPQIGGTELVVHHLAEGLSKQGITVTVATFCQSNIIPYCSYKLNRIFVPKGLKRIQSVYRRYRSIMLEKAIRQEAPDLIHAHYLYPIGYELIQLKKKRALRIPVVVTCHGVDIQKDKRLNYGWRLDSEIEQNIMFTAKHVDKLVAIGSDVIQELQAIGVDNEKIERCNNPIAYDALSGSHKQTKLDFGFDDDVPMILAVGRNHPKKNFHALIDVIQILKNRNFPVQGVFVGENVPDLKSYAEKLNLLDSVSFFESVMPAGVSYIDEDENTRRSITDFFGIADVYAMTSEIESFGLVTVEAMASGTPVVAMKAKGTSDLITHNYNGLLVDGDKGIFADRIMELINTPERSLSIAKNAQIGAEKYSREAVAKQHIKLYKKLIDSN